MSCATTETITTKTITTGSHAIDGPKETRTKTMTDFRIVAASAETHPEATKDKDYFKESIMAWSLLRGHGCDPTDVRSGYCGQCGTIWNRNDSDWDLTKKALKGVDVRGEDGKRPPLF